MGFLQSLPLAPEQKAYAGRLWESPRKRLGIIVTLVIVLVLFMHTALGISYLPQVDSLHTYRTSEGARRNSSWPVVSDYDIVVAHYDEDLAIMRDSIAQVSGLLPRGVKRVVIYHKGGRDKAGLEELLDMADEVVALPNVGREGETYLSHIVRHYDTASTNLAEHTIFMQPHLAWHWVFLPRLKELLSRHTGFLSFGPYLSHTCGKDSTGQVFPRMADIYNIFRADLCPPTPVLATWAGQFVVSRTRILENQKRAYANLRAVFHSPTDHWIWKEGWWNDKPSNPTLGHALERSWPMVFNCTDASKADTCGENDVNKSCQCLD